MVDRMDSRWWVTVLVMLCGVLLVSSGMGAVPVPVLDDADALVEVRDQPPRYEDGLTGLPVTVLVAGETVRWVWEGGLPHTVTSDPEGSLGSEHFDSGFVFPSAEDPKPVFEASFTEPGVYRYHCLVHLEQEGVLIVL